MKLIKDGECYLEKVDFEFYTIPNEIMGIAEYYSESLVKFSDPACVYYFLTNNDIIDYEDVCNLSKKQILEIIRSNGDSFLTRGMRHYLIHRDDIDDKFQSILNGEKKYGVRK